MKLAIAIPMKPLHLAKQRLRPGLNDAARQELARAMLTHVLTAVAASGVAEICGIVSADPAALALAVQYGFEPIVESQPRGYNAAATRASIWAQQRGADALLILPADLPRLIPADICAMAKLAKDHPRVIVIAPDKTLSGTNALLLRPPNVIPTQFGPDSFQAHCQVTINAAMLLRLYNATTLSHDVDWPTDLTP